MRDILPPPSRDGSIPDGLLLEFDRHGGCVAMPLGGWLLSTLNRASVSLHAWESAMLDKQHRSLRKSDMATIAR